APKSSPTSGVQGGDHEGMRGARAGCVARLDAHKRRLSSHPAARGSGGFSQNFPMPARNTSASPSRCRPTPGGQHVSATVAVEEQIGGGFMGKRLRKALFAGLIALGMLAVNTAFAQVNTADILGTVTDAGGAVIANAKVTVVNTTTNDIKTTTTN